MTIEKNTHIRYLIVTMLFIASCFSYGDRVALSIAGAAMQKELALDPVKLGFLLSSFSWAYVAGQLPSGGLLDRFGSKRVYGISIVCWTVCAFLIGFTGYLATAWIFSTIFILRLLSGLAQSPVFPGNGRIVAAWSLLRSLDGSPIPTAGEAVSGLWGCSVSRLPSFGQRQSIA
jgi:ACS family glucarate transporter-like MFS transporter